MTRILPPGTQRDPRARCPGRAAREPNAGTRLQARPAPPRRTGQAHRPGEVRRRPRLPRRLVRRHHPLHRAARHLLGIELDEAFDWSQVVVVTAADIPGDNVVSLIRDDQPILVPVGGEIRHQAEALCLIAAADRETLRAAKRHLRVRTERLPASSTRSSRPRSSRTSRCGRATSRRASPRPSWSSKGRIASDTRSSSTSRTRP